MEKSILDYLYNSAERFPSKVAYKDSEGGAITFQELKKEVEVIGSYIISKVGEEFNKPIVILTERNIRSIPAFMAAVYSGNFYVPIDATLPEERIKTMLDLAEPLLVINCSDKSFEIEGAKIVEYSKIKEENISILPQRKTINTSPLYGIS